MRIIAECEAYCQKILKLVDADVLGVETEHFIDASQATKSTVGLMVSFSNQTPAVQAMPMRTKSITSTSVCMNACTDTQYCMHVC